MCTGAAITQELKLEMSKLYNEGNLTMAEIGKKLRIATSTVSIHLVRDPKKIKASKLSDEEKAEIYARYGKYQTMTRLAADYKVSQSTIRKTISELNKK